MVANLPLESAGTREKESHESPRPGPPTYDELRAEHRWSVPARYNIAADVCDKHPRDKLAMVWEDWRGGHRELSWGELQDLAAKFANVLRERGVERGDRVAMLLPATPETAAAFLGTWKAGGILLSMSVLYGDDGIRHRVSDSQAKVLVTDAENADRVEPGLVEEVIILDDSLLADASKNFETVDTAADDPAQLYYSSGTTGLAKGILHAHRYVLAHEEFVYCHDLARGSSFTAWANGRGRPGSRRCSARGVLAPRSSSSSERAASIPSSSCRCSRSRARQMSSRRRPRCGR